MAFRGVYPHGGSATKLEAWTLVFCAREAQFVFSSVAGRSAPNSRDAFPIPGMELKTADANALCRKSLRSMKLVTYQDAVYRLPLRILSCACRLSAHSRLQHVLQGKGNPLWGKWRFYRKLFISLRGLFVRGCSSSSKIRQASKPSHWLTSNRLKSVFNPTESPGFCLEEVYL